MKIYKSGMVSVTFRPYSVKKVIAAAKKAGLDGIEWGGDIHISHGDIAAAAEAASACREAGLEVFSYGSYYRAGQEQDFKMILDTASALRSPNIRVWAGVKASAESDCSDREKITADIKNAARLAGERDISVSFEHHGGTLTDGADSAVMLIREIGAPNVSLYWQPNQFRDRSYNEEALKKILPYLSNIHVFQWRGDKKSPLRTGYEDWARYLDIIHTFDQKNGASGSVINGTRGFFLEFSPDGTEEAFFDDADCLIGWLGKLLRF